MCLLGLCHWGADRDSGATGVAPRGVALAAAAGPQSATPRTAATPENHPKQSLLDLEAASTTSKGQADLLLGISAKPLGAT